MQSNGVDYTYEKECFDWEGDQISCNSDKDEIDDTEWKGSDLDDLEDEGMDNFDAGVPLVEWSATCFILGIIVGVMLLLVDLIPNNYGIQAIMHSVVLLGSYLIGLFLTLIGTKWLGLLSSELFSLINEDAYVESQLGVMPYYFLLTGIIIMSISIPYFKSSIGKLIGLGSEPIKSKLNFDAILQTLTVSIILS